MYLSEVFFPVCVTTPRSRDGKGSSCSPKFLFNSAISAWTIFFFRFKPHRRDAGREGVHGAGRRKNYFPWIFWGAWKENIPPKPGIANGKQTKKNHLVFRFYSSVWCLHVSMSPFLYFAMFPCLMSMFPCFHVSISMSLCLYVSMSLFSPSPWPCLHVSGILHMENGNFSLFAANRKRKQQTSVFASSGNGKAEVCFPWSANDK